MPGHFEYFIKKRTKQKFQIIATGLHPSYLGQVSKDLKVSFEELHRAGISTGTFSFYISVS